MKETLKKLWEWIKKPHGTPLFLFYVFSAAFIACAIVFSVLGQDNGYGVIAYVFYGLAAVSLGYSVYTIVVFFPCIKRKIAKKIKTNRFAANVLGNYDLKTTVFALSSFVITVAFAVVNLVNAIFYTHVWYGALAAYYFVLILFRGGVLFADKKCSERFGDGEKSADISRWRINMASGAFLIVVVSVMMGVITQMMLSERPFQSGEITAIITATYTFYKITMAVYNLIKARKISNPVTQSLRNLNFADACMSVVSLTVLLISTFGNENTSVGVHYMKYAVGFFVCAVIIAMATFMIISANKKITLLKSEKNY